MDTNQVRICVPVCANTAADLVERAQLAASAGDVVELRLDCLRDQEINFNDLLARTRNLRRPTIITLRPAEQGGHCDLSQSDRKKFWTEHSPALAESFLDLELDLVREFAQAAEPQCQWDQVICSHHDF